MAPKMVPGHENLDRFVAAPPRNNQAVVCNDQNGGKVHGVIVFTSKEADRKYSIFYYQDLTAMSHELAHQALSSREWFDLPLPRQLGMPLQFSTWKWPDHGRVNHFVDTMCVNPDFERVDEDIAKYRFNKTHPETVYGSIMVIRSDGRDLWPQDIEALAEFVGAKLPSIEFYAVRRRWG
jgi:hypothetical protein